MNLALWGIPFQIPAGTLLIFPLLTGILALISLLLAVLLYLHRRKYRKELKNDIHKEMIVDIHDLLFNELPLDFLILDANGLCLDMNQAFLGDLQIDKETFTGRKATDYIRLLQDKQNVLPEFISELQGGKKIIKFSNNSFIQNPENGITFLISGSIIGVFDKKGKLIRIVLYFRNIIEERTLKYVLNMALCRMHIFYWSFDMKRNVMDIDPRYFEYLGIPARDCTLTIEEFRNLMHPEDWASVEEALSKQIQGNLVTDSVVYRLRRADGNWEWFEAQSTYLGQLSDLPYRIVGICMSIQKFKDNELILNDALKRAERSDQLKLAFLANMSHEIRTPLNAIVGFSSLMSESLPDIDEASMKEYAEIIDTNSKLLMLLISDILDLSKIESNTMEYKFMQVSLNDLFTDIYNSQKILVDRVDLIKETPVQDVVIVTDPGRLRQVICNLINNAIKFTHEGSITIGYKMPDGDCVRIFVEDTGAGMPPEVAAHIFERFYKGDSFVQGTGLGLAICKTIVNKFKGDIQVTSQIGKGSCFTVTLPINVKK